MLRVPYLVQRCIVRNRPAEGLRFSQVADLDYMGAAEYEFGAVPASLRAIAARADEYRIIDVGARAKALRDEADMPLLVYSGLSDEFLGEYIAHLKQLRAGKLGTKSSSYFDDNPQAGSYRKRVTLWWDLDNDTLFSFDGELIRAMPQLMANSLVYMNAQKRA